MFKRNLIRVWVGILCLSGMFLMGQESWYPKDFTKLSTLVPMADGTKIAVDAFIPTNCPEPCEPPFPTVFQYLPYGRATADPFFGLLTDEVEDASDGDIVKSLLSNGYAFVIADMRGTGASSGWKADFMPALADDGKEIVDWIAAQSWCDGNVGMTGASYHGWSQLAVASRAPEALKCIMPIIAPFELFTTAPYPGGIYSYALVQSMSAVLDALSRNMYVPGFINPTVPAFDEDGDGQYVDEIPKYQYLNTGGTLTDYLTFTDDYPWPVQPSNPPRYLDGVARTAHTYFNATMEHVAHPDGAPGNYDAMTISQDLYYINAPLPVDNLTAYDYLNIPEVMSSGIPIYNAGGWFDIYTRGTVRLYATMKETNVSRLFLVPNYHLGMSQGFADYFGVDPDDFYWESDWAKQETLRWFERWLKGIENGIEFEPPIKIYVMNGEGVREENEWPLARQVMSKFYFDEDGKLAAQTANNGTDAYVTDYTHKSGFEEIDASFLVRLGRPSVIDTFYRNRYTITHPPTQLPVRTENDLKCLTYTSDPMTEDTEVTGHPIVHLWVSSTVDHGDLFFYLEDVDESGEAVLITENPLRIGFAGLVDDDEQINPNPGVDVLPNLPWHGFEDTDYVDGILAGGNIVEIVNDLHPTSWVFRQGHRMRISIACSDWPTFRLNPHLYAGTGNPTNVPGDYIAPTITVYRGDSRPSHIELPIIP